MSESVESSEFEEALLRLRLGTQTKEDVEFMISEIKKDQDKIPEPKSYPLVITVDHNNVARLNGDLIGEFNTNRSPDEVVKWFVEALVELIRERIG